MKGLGSVKDWGRGRRVRRLEEGQWAAGSGGWGVRGLGAMWFGSLGSPGFVRQESGGDVGVMHAWRAWVT